MSDPNPQSDGRVIVARLRSVSLEEEPERARKEAREWWQRLGYRLESCNSDLTDAEREQVALRDQLDGIVSRIERNRERRRLKAELAGLGPEEK